MNAGRVEQIGAPLDLYDRPANLFVAGFIGSPAMNIFGGTITPQGFAAAGATLPLPPGTKAAGQGSYGIRPEHLLVDPSGLEAKVLLIEPTGSETQVTMMLGEQTIIGVFRERISVAPGQTIRIRPDLASVHLFDAQGQRIVA